MNLLAPAARLRELSQRPAGDPSVVRNRAGGAADREAAKEEQEHSMIPPADHASLRETDPSLTTLAAEVRMGLEGRVGRLPRSHALSPVLLTGATGYLGANLLHELLARTDATVHCLVRASSTAHAVERIARSLSAYTSPPDERTTQRVLPILGDLSLPYLGLDPHAFGALARTIGTVIHSGARVNFVRPYAVLRATNVAGTREILRLATLARLKPVHFVSTAGVVMASGVADPGSVAEDDVLEGRGVLPNGYEQTKWVADQLCASARREGVPVYTYRVGLVGGDSRSGAYVRRGEYLPSLLKGCIQLGCAPALRGESLVVPVDYVSRALVDIAARTDVVPQTFLVNHPRPIPLLHIVGLVREMGYPVRAVPFDEWRRDLFALSEVAFRENALYPYRDYLRDLDEPHADSPRFSAKNATTVLSHLACPSVDEILRKYFDHFVRTGFLPPPPGRGDS
jgi:thioester reductase-like protein